jgi:hypothetical protein
LRFVGHLCISSPYSCSGVGIEVPC